MLYLGQYKSEELSQIETIHEIRDKAFNAVEPFFGYQAYRTITAPWHVDIFKSEDGFDADATFNDRNLLATFMSAMRYFVWEVEYSADTCAFYMTGEWQLAEN